MSDEPPLPRTLLERATRVLGNEAKARRWLTRSDHNIDGKSPAQAPRTDDGLSEVEDLLGCIEHGIVG